MGVGSWTSLGDRTKAWLALNWRCISAMLSTWEVFEPRIIHSTHANQRHPPRPACSHSLKQPCDQEFWRPWAQISKPPKKIDKTHSIGGTSRSTSRFLTSLAVSITGISWITSFLLDVHLCRLKPLCRHISLKLLTSATASPTDGSHFSLSST